MQSTKLPATYKGYSTEELLEIQEALSTSLMTERLKEVLRKADTDKTNAAQDMVWEFQLTGAAKVAAELRSEFRRKQNAKAGRTLETV